MGRPTDPPAPDAGGGVTGEGQGAVRSAVRAPEIAYHPARGPAVRRGTADPVKVLMHRHRDLCEHAVDPLEIAAGLEAHGLTDRTAARYRHRDVFSLAEELYARVPGAGRHAPAPRGRGRTRAAAHGPDGRSPRCCPGPPVWRPPGRSGPPRGCSAVRPGSR